MNRYVSIKIGADLRGEITKKKNLLKDLFLVMLTVKKWDI